ncbi:nucleotide pyrophosphatase/phosphodiesterase-like isoform X2 [Rutidosis leptorrhynchoides]|uniref:nucleotide pyrophosphatase/phosphodiesterase-like isoform X2 n=1 Tax=Rutidosis leptorrhynchoides TaxID=125765 RepID=UPI003A98F958
MWFIIFLSFFVSFLHHTSTSPVSPNLLPINLLDGFQNYTAISEFRLLNRRKLGACLDPNPYVKIHVNANSKLGNDQMIKVTVSGVLFPSENDWVGIISPSHANVDACPQNFILYEQTGDFSELPLLCHYPVKMRLTWVSGDKKPQKVQWNGKSRSSNVTTFSQKDMCNSVLPSPAKDFGWHDPGYIHSAVMTGLKPSKHFSYIYGSKMVGWSARTKFKTPPREGSNELKFLAFGDMGKAPRDASVEHYIQPGSVVVTQAMADEISSGNADSIFHIGDISYATGFLVEWDFFLHLISPLASKVSYMTAIGNHERDYVNSGSVYFTPDSGGECGVPYESYFQMPTSAKDKPWYSIEQGSVHFVVMSTEHDWSKNSEQYKWMSKDMASVDRSRTPWLIFTGHRPMYTSCGGVDPTFVLTVEPLLIKNKVDLVLFGHVHNYERTCAVYGNECKAMPKKRGNGVDTYDNNNYTAPVHAIIGMAGFRLDTFPPQAGSWSTSRISKFGYARVHTTKTQLNFEVCSPNFK